MTHQQGHLFGHHPEPIAPIAPPRAVPPRPPAAALTYAPGSSGHATVDTSREAIEAMDASGVTSAVQSKVLKALLDHPSGMTWSEVDEVTGIHHHGRTSSALTNLRRAGAIFWLHRRRGNAHIFVHGRWRPYFNDDEIKVDAPRRTANRDEAAGVVARLFGLYLEHPDPERWEAVVAAHAQWAAAS